MPISKDFELISFVKDNQSYIDAGQMIDRARELNANVGQKEAEYFLEHQDEIPEDWRKWYIVFPEWYTRNYAGDELVGYLCWDSSQWIKCLNWLDGALSNSIRLPIKKSLDTGKQGA